MKFSLVTAALTAVSFVAAAPALGAPGNDVGYGNGEKPPGHGNGVGHGKGLGGNFGAVRPKPGKGHGGKGPKYPPGHGMPGPHRKPLVSAVSNFESS